ncbi:MAG: hypothetical protein Q7S50_02440 [bacterium]|nr:hypothetical protein [bacterium]
MARKLDMNDYIATMPQNIFEPVQESEPTGIADEREMDRYMTTPRKGIARDSFILRFRKVRDLDPSSRAKLTTWLGKPEAGV